MNTTRKMIGSIVAIVLLAMVTVISFAFKAEKRDTPTNGWYIVNITGDPNDPNDANNEANQAITTLTSTPPLEDELGCAQQFNTGKVCRVHLTFQPGATVPTTVAAARLTGSLTTVEAKAQSPEE